jgi:hypothetical protein
MHAPAAEEVKKLRMHRIPNCSIIECSNEAVMLCISLRIATVAALLTAALLGRANDKDSPIPAAVVRRRHRRLFCREGE